MSQDLLRFYVSNLSASAPEGLTIRWRGREFASGPLTVELDQEGDHGRSHGVLDYGPDAHTPSSMYSSRFLTSPRCSRGWVSTAS